MASLQSLYVRIAGDTSGLEQTLDDAPSRLQKAGEKIKGAATAIGAGLGLALTSAVGTAMDQESITDKLSAQLGATGDRAKELGSVAGKVYAAGWGDSMDQVAEAIKGVQQNIGDLGEGAAGGLEGLSTKALAVATTFDQDLGGTTNAVAQMLRTGLAGSADEAFDIITAGFQAGDDKAGDFLDTLNEYGVQFKKFGLDGQEAAGLISQGLQAGARDGDLVADAIKEFSIRSIDGSQTTAQGFSMIGLSAQDMAAKIGRGGKDASDALDLTLDRLRGIKDPVQQAAAASALFGTQAEDLGQALFALDPSSAVDALGKVGGAADQMAATVADNPAAAIETFKRSAQQKLTEVAGSFISFGEQNQGAVQPMIIGLGVLAAAVLAVRVGMALWEAATVAWSAAQKIATAVQWAFNVAMDANPVALIIIAVLALVAGIVLLYQNSDTARAIIQTAFAVIFAVIMAPYNWVTTNWPLLLGILTWPFQEGERLAEAALALALLAIMAPYNWVHDHWGDILDVLAWPFNEGQRIIGAVWADIVAGGERVWGWIQDMPGKIQGALSTVAGILFAPFKAGFNAIATGWNNSVGRVGFSVPDWVPGVGGRSFHIPQVPLLDVGGFVTSTGLAVIHQGETVVPAGTAPLPTLPPGASGGGQGAGAVLELRSSGQRIDDLLLEILRDAIHNRGGNVQTVLGA